MFKDGAYRTLLGKFLIVEESAVCLDILLVSLLLEIDSAFNSFIGDRSFPDLSFYLIEVNFFILSFWVKKSITSDREGLFIISLSVIFNTNTFNLVKSGLFS